MYPNLLALAVFTSLALATPQGNGVPPCTGTQISLINNSAEESCNAVLSFAQCKLTYVPVPNYTPDNSKHEAAFYQCWANTPSNTPRGGVEGTNTKANTYCTALLKCYLPKK
jgi:hypothetical protein